MQFDLEVIHKNRFYPVKEIIATVRFYQFNFIQELLNFITFQCNEKVDRDIFPGWQWQKVNPVTKKVLEEFEPWNTTLPPCSK